MITFVEIDCDRRGCGNFKVCRPLGAFESMRFRIASVDEEIECPRGRKLTVVSLE